MAPLQPLKRVTGLLCLPFSVIPWIALTGTVPVGGIIWAIMGSGSGSSHDTMTIAGNSLAFLVAVLPFFPTVMCLQAILPEMFEDSPKADPAPRVAATAAEKDAAAACSLTDRILTHMG